MVVTGSLGILHSRDYRRCFCQEDEIDRIFYTSECIKGDFYITNNVYIELRGKKTKI